MASRNRRAVPPPSAPAAATRAGTHLPDGAPAQRTRTHMQTRTGTLQDGEHIDLGNVSGSEDEYEPVDSDHGDDGNSTAQGEDNRHSLIRVNDPDTPPLPKTAAADIWYFFDKSGDKVVCNECRKTREADPSKWSSSIHYEFSKKTSTTSLRPHIEKYHLELYMTVAVEKKWKIMLPGLLSQAQSQASSDATTSQGERPDKFSERAFHQQLLNFIIVDDQSLNLVECREFRMLLLLLRNNLKETIIPHRTKVRELIIQAWKQYFQILRRDLAASMGQVSFTTDVWSDQNRQPFLAITAHWIAMVEGTTALQLKTALIAFHRLRGRHDGKSLAKTVLKLLDRARVTVKVGHFTMDNASSNGTMMKYLEPDLNDREIGFDAVDRQVMCFGHVIDLSSRRVIGSVGSIRDTVDDEDDSAQSDGDAGVSAPIPRARNVVRAIRGSGLRRDAFDEVIVNGNAKGWFKQGRPPQIVKLKPLQLLRDVRTRWDSVYHMLNRLRELRPAVDHFLALPNNSDLAKYQISSQDWAVMQDLEFVLSVPHVVQKVMSGESTPILCGAIPAFEMYMTTWEKIIRDHPRLERLVRPGLDWASMYYGRMDRTRAYVVTMLLNPAMRMTWINKHWDREYITMAETKIRETMVEYRERGATRNNEGQSVPTTRADTVDPHAGETPKYMSLAEQYGLGGDMDVGDSGANEQTIEQEYQAYITAPLSPKNVNILKFWEVNRASFPTLFAMAMDYLPIQATSVPCERVFSSSAETDTKRRNRISPLLMEALQMLKFHMKKECLNFTEAWMTSEKQMVEDDPEDDLLQNLLDGDFQDGLDRVIQSINDDED